MTVRELELYFERIIPHDLSCEWDNDGLMLCADQDKEIRHALLTLDVTENAVEKAISCGADVIFTHHPFIFRGLKSFCDKDARVRLALRLISAGISVFSYHTRLDALQGGVNDTLGSFLGLSNTRPLGEGEASMARIGDIDQLSPNEFASIVKRNLKCPSILFAEADSGDKYVRRVALLGGACDMDFVRAAIEADADVLVCGELSYNSILDANLEGLHVICAGHYFTEMPVMSFFEEHLQNHGISSEAFGCCEFKYI